MADVAQELLDNQIVLSEQESRFLTAAANYKRSIVAKKKMLGNRMTEDVDQATRRSYRIRLLLDLY